MDDKTPPIPLHETCLRVTAPSCLGPVDREPRTRALSDRGARTVDLLKIVAQVQPAFVSFAWAAVRRPKRLVLQKRHQSLQTPWPSIRSLRWLYQVGGWLTLGVGNSYGSGFPVVVIQRWIERLE